MRYRWIVLALVIVLAGCAGRDDAALSAKQVATRAAEKLEATEQLHFVIERTGVQAPGALALQQAEGDVVIPDKIRAKVQASTFGITSELGVVAIGDQQWMTNPLSGQWQALAADAMPVNLRLLFDPQSGVAGLLRTGEWTEVASDGGVYTIRATFDGQQLATMTSGLIAQGAVDLRAKINAQDFFLAEALLIETDTSAEEPSTWRLQFSDPSGAVEIVPPPVQ